MCAWLMITASRSSKLKLNQSKRGYAFNPKASPGLIPQSNITLLSGVTTIKQDLPTCLTPPRQNNITSSLLIGHDCCGGGLVLGSVVIICCCRSCLLCLFSSELPFMPLMFNIRGFRKILFPSSRKNTVLSLAEFFNVE